MDLVREALPLHEVDEMGRDVDQALALLRGVEEPRRPLDRHAGHQLGKVVDALLGHGRLRLGALRSSSPKTSGILENSLCSIVVISCRSVMMS